MIPTQKQLNLMEAAFGSLGIQATIDADGEGIGIMPLYHVHEMADLMIAIEKPTHCYLIVQGARVTNASPLTVEIGNVTVIGGSSSMTVNDPAHPLFVAVVAVLLEQQEMRLRELEALHRGMEARNN